MVRRNKIQWVAVWSLSLPLLLTGCGDVFNAAFLNTTVGGALPVTPGPGAAFVFVRCVNDTSASALRFSLTIERETLVRSDSGDFRLDDEGNFITETKRENFLLSTLPQGRAREIGMLFPCGESPVTVIGLGENLDRNDSAVFVDGGGAGGAEGFGVAAGDLTPLTFEAGNFTCGDTVIFRAFESTGVAGGVGIQSFRIRGEDQPSIFSGSDTFVNYAEFLESQNRDTGP